MCRQAEKISLSLAATPSLLHHLALFDHSDIVLVDILRHLSYTSQIFAGCSAVNDKAIRRDS